MINESKCNKLDKIYNIKTKRCNKKCKENFIKADNNKCISKNREFLEKQSRGRASWLGGRMGAPRWGVIRQIRGLRCLRLGF